MRLRRFRTKGGDFDRSRMDWYARWQYFRTPGRQYFRTPGRLGSGFVAALRDRPAKRLETKQPQDPRGACENLTYVRRAREAARRRSS